MKHRIHCLFFLCALSLTACHTEEHPEIKTDFGYTMETEVLNFKESGLEPNPSDTPYLLGNNAIVLGRFVVKGNNADYYHFYLLNEDGSASPLSSSAEYFRLIMGTDENEFIITDDKGKTVICDEDWTQIKEIPSLYDGYALDGGRYFAFNDAFMTDYDALTPEDKDVKPELFALYRYTEKLSESIYIYIKECAEGYKGYYVAEDGTVEEHIFFVNDAVEKPLSEINTTYNSIIKKYVTLDWGGNNVFGTEFDYASPIVNDRMIIRAGKDFFLAHIEKTK